MVILYIILYQLIFALPPLFEALETLSLSYSSGKTGRSSLHQLYSFFLNYTYKLVLTDLRNLQIFRFGFELGYLDPRIPRFPYGLRYVFGFSCRFVTFSWQSEVRWSRLSELCFLLWRYSMSCLGHFIICFLFIWWVTISCFKSEPVTIQWAANENSDTADMRVIRIFHVL